MEERVKWYIREYRYANGVSEKIKFPAVMDGRIREGTRRYARSVNRAEKQAAESARELARLMNNNFEAGRDCYLTLDYGQWGMDRLVMRAGTDGEDELYESAEREMENYTKRLRRACRKAGVELRYAYVTSDMDGETLAPVRVHHHLVVNAEAAALAEACWTAGGAKAKVLYGPHGDLTELAEYMIRQTRLSSDGRQTTQSSSATVGSSAKQGTRTSGISYTGRSRLSHARESVRISSGPTLSRSSMTISQSPTPLLRLLRSTGALLQ